MKSNLQEIKDKTLSAFTVMELKKAREDLFSYIDPDAKGYNGPNNSTEKEKASHCFDLIFNKMKELDAKANSLIFACPSIDLNVLPITSSSHDCTAEFSRVHKDIGDLREKLSNLSTQLTRCNSTKLSSRYRDTLIDNNRDRSMSVSKRKRDSNSSTPEPVETDDDTFQLSRQDKKKLARRNSGPRPGAAQEPVIPGAMAKKLPIRKFSVGTRQPHPGSRFKGVVRNVPKAFLSKCDLDAEPEDIVEHFSLEGIGVSNVELAKPSRPTLRPPRSKSFILSFHKFEDYLKVMSGGVFLPEHVEVKKFFAPRSPVPISSVEDQIQELDKILTPESSEIVPHPDSLPQGSGQQLSASQVTVHASAEDSQEITMDTLDVGSETLSTITKDSTNTKDLDLATSQSNNE